MEQTKDSFFHVEAIFHQAMAAPAEERARLIEELCEGDAELAAEAKALIEAGWQEEQATASQRRDAGAKPAACDTERKRIGAYELDRLLGRGGMGAVYLAHRADGQFEQQVAIKLIDLPLATAIFRERFRQERQILAGLQHPYIARLLDGGVTDGGDPFLVMDYVNGVPIHRFCEGHSLDKNQRLALFLHVCEAVQFAHQNFVVHRDLKPDNILVVEDGTPRLLDFGTAKLLTPVMEGPAGEMTLEGYRSFTPQYASPEQVLGNPITTASDTYSLGVLLYLLLTGSHPYEMKEMTTAEMVRVVCEQPPHRPSQRTASGQRLDGDLEAILLKALRKEPGMRYLSAEQLAGDLKAYLAGRPVAARHGTLRYRAGKFIRRNRLALTAACLLAATLLAGVVGVAWLAHVANRQRRKAEARSADLRQLSNSLLSELNEAIKELPGSTGAQKLLVTRVLDHLDRMGKDTQGDRQTQLDLADAYIQLGEIQGDPYVQNIGEPLAALISLDKAIKVTAPLAAANAADHEAVRSLAVAQQYRSDVLFGMNRTQEAVVSMQASVGAWDQLVAARDVTPALLCDAGSAFGTLGDEEGQSGTASLGDPVAAEAAYRKALAADARALAIDPHLARATRGLAIYRMKIGSLVAETDPARAIPEFQGAMRSIEALPDAVRNTLSSARLRAVLQRKQAIALEHTGEYAQAMPLFKEAIAFHQNAVAQDPKDFRALLDLVVALDDESLAYEDAANPVLGTRPGDRRNNLLHVRSDLLQSTADLDRLLSHDPDHNDWKTFLGLMQVRLDSAERALHSPGATGERSRKSIAAAKLLAASGQASPEILNQTASAILLSATASRTDLQSAVSISERDVKLCHGLRPEHVLVLAEAYRATGQIEKSRATAKQGLALLPSVESGAPKSNIRKLLEIQAK